MGATNRNAQTTGRDLAALGIQQESQEIFRDGRLSRETADGSYAKRGVAAGRGNGAAVPIDDGTRRRRYGDDARVAGQQDASAGERRGVPELLRAATRDEGRGCEGRERDATKESETRRDREAETERSSCSGEDLREGGGKVDCLCLLQASIYTKFY